MEPDELTPKEIDLKKMFGDPPRLCWECQWLSVLQYLMI